MTENDVYSLINNDPIEKRNEFIDHPSYIKIKKNETIFFTRNEITSILALIDSSIMYLMVFHSFWFPPSSEALGSRAPTIPLEH